MKEKRFHFWQKCLTWANVMATLIGVLVAFAGNSLLFELHNEYTIDVFFQGQGFSPEVLSLKNWLFGIIGGTIVGFHLLMIFISEYAYKRREPWAFWAMGTGLLSWFLIDSAISWYYGALHNIILINLVALVLIGLPLLMTREVFVQKSV